MALAATLISDMEPSVIIRIDKTVPDDIGKLLWVSGRISSVQTLGDRISTFENLMTNTRIITNAKATFAQTTDDQLWKRSMPANNTSPLSPGAAERALVEHVLHRT